MADFSASKHHYTPMETERSYSSLLKTKQRTAFAYGFMFAFVLFSTFIAFSPNSNSSFPWLSNVFSSLNSNFNSSDPHDSQLASILSYLSPNNKSVSPAESAVNQTYPSPPPRNSSAAAKAVNQENVASYYTAKKQGKEGGESSSNEEKFARLAKQLENCDFFDGDWIRDDSYPLYKPGACSFIDVQFNCILNGRPDKDFQLYKWKPKHCDLPRLNPDHMMKMLRGKRLAFVGDSLNRNMWESLVCILKQKVKNQTQVYEASGKQSFKGEASYSFVFSDYNFTVEFFASPFLVQESDITGNNGSKQETLRLDLVGRTSDQYKTADIIVFNTGHWWTHEKTSLGKDYYQEGSHVYSDLNVLDAFRKALTTWATWVDNNVNSSNTFVLFRGYSETHFSGGQWNSGGACDHEVEPIKNSTYLREYSTKMVVLEEVMNKMATRVEYMNITRMTDFRKDGHPSIYRHLNLSEEERRSPAQFQDCSHWCLPGVPDTWNEILYAELLVRGYGRRSSYT